MGDENEGTVEQAPDTGPGETGGKPGDRPLPPGVTPNADGTLPDLDKAPKPGMGTLYEVGR